MQQTIQPLPSSYRDPSGFMFEKDGTLFRQVNKIFQQHYEHFIKSGCYEYLQKNNLIVTHQEIEKNFSDDPDWYKTLEPEKIPFISYPYEWSFNMLKDAALLTLELVRTSVKFGMILKDASPYNIQWLNGKPVFIDSLSFERYDTSQPWIAYRQFCESFLSPLLLMHYSKQPLQPLMLAFPEGIPLGIASALLPMRSRFSLHTYLHIHFHSRFAGKKSNQALPGQNNFTEQKLKRLIESLESLVRRLRWKPSPSNWTDYYKEAGQRKDYLEYKKKIVLQLVTDCDQVQSAVDLGANEGEFSSLLANRGVHVIATDFEHNVIDNLYLRIKKENQTKILPLVIDIANPSPAIGVNNNERASFTQRVNSDLVLALALIHHLAIGKNIPFKKMAGQFAALGRWLIIEFVPRSDEKIQFMLQQKKDIYHQYTEQSFEETFLLFFEIKNKMKIGDSGRTIYLMKRHE